MKFIALLLLFPCIVLSFDIIECSVDGDGSDADSPLEEGKIKVKLSIQYFLNGKNDHC